MRLKLLGLMGLFLPVLGWTESASPASSPELTAIEQQLADLKKRLHEEEVEEMNEEVEGQGYMIADWPAYAREMEKVKETDDGTKQLQKQIEQLEQRKADLLKQQTSR